jgi:hypothetical protein
MQDFFGGKTMDNFDLGSSDKQNLDNPIPLDNDLDNPIPLDDMDGESRGVSHSPLDLGGSRPIEVHKVPKPQPKPIAAAQMVNIATQTISNGRISGVRTFFTKLHSGALSFLDEQIIDWLKKNPDIYIKRTNVTVGEIQGKKTEPNILITVWY